MSFRFFFVIVVYLISHFAHAEKISINGAEIEYEIKGNGSTFLLFDAGAISGMSGWDSIWSKLPDDTTAIRYSRRGEGDSSACYGDLNSEDYVIDVEGLINS